MVDYGFVGRIQMKLDIINTRLVPKKQCFRIIAYQTSSLYNCSVFGDSRQYLQVDCDAGNDSVQVCLTLLKLHIRLPCYRTLLDTLKIQLFRSERLLWLSYIPVVVQLADLPTVWEHPGNPSTPLSFMHDMQRLHVKYNDMLSFGLYQTVAILDAGWLTDRVDATVSDENRLNICGYAQEMISGSKLTVAFNVVDYVDNKDFEGDIFGHGSSIWKLIAGNVDGITCGLPESFSRLGVAFNAKVALLRVVEGIHCAPPTSNNTKITIAIKAALQFVIANRDNLNITHVHISILMPNVSSMHKGNILSPDNISFVDELYILRSLGISITAPAGNECKEAGVTWPAILDNVYAIGALDASCNCSARRPNICSGPPVDVIVRSTVHTSGATSYMSAFFMLLREAIIKYKFKWMEYGNSLPAASMCIFKKTSTSTSIDRFGHESKVVDINAALEYIINRRAE